jgi:predicted MPP superfamily phosphohydrolase
MPVHEAIRYVLGAYLVFALLLVTYWVIIARHTIRTRRELAALTGKREDRGR